LKKPCNSRIAEQTWHWRRACSKMFEEGKKTVPTK